MNSSTGWIKLHRKMLDNPVVTKDADHLALWTYILLQAVHEPRDVFFEGRRFTLAPGQFTAGRRQIADFLRVSESKVQRMLDCFESEQQIEQQTNNKSRLITVKNWTRYQIDEQQSEQQMNNKRTTTEQQLNTNKEYKNIRNKEYIPPIVPLAGARTPGEEARQFFQDSAYRDTVLAEELEKRDAEPNAFKSEMERFVSYWTEPSKSGRQVRWELERAFEVRRRIATWLSRKTLPPRACTAVSVEGEVTFIE